MRKRRADFVANLIVYDEPHLVYLKSGKQNVLAVAVTSLPGDEFDFFATTISSFIGNLNLLPSHPAEDQLLSPGHPAGSESWI